MMQSPDGSVHVPVEADAQMDTIEKLFTYHKPTVVQAQAYVDIRLAAKALARQIDKNCPPSPDRTVAMRQLRECVMTANASIATGGGHYR